MIFSWSLPDEFLGASSPSRLDFTPPLPPPSVTVETSPSCSLPTEVAGSHGDVTPSVSSDSVSLPTQLEILPERCANAPSRDEKRKSATAAEGAGAREQGAEEEGARTEGAREQEARKEGAKEEGVQDLRVFELNSDSGKSTPSTNGKKGEVGRTGRCEGRTENVSLPHLNN